VVVAAVELDAAAVGHLLDQRPQQRRLARAVQPDQGGDLAAADLGRHPVEDGPAAQLHLQVAQAHQRGGHRRPFARVARWARSLRSCQSAVRSSRSHVSSGSPSTTLTRPTPAFFSSRWSVSAAVLGYCGSAAMSTCSWPLHLAMRLASALLPGSTPAADWMAPMTFRPKLSAK